MASYFVTGASRGLGLEFVRQLRSRGDTVYAGVRTPASVKELDRMGAEVVEVDVTDAASVDAAGRVMAGKVVDVLVNNAGVNSDQKRLAELSAAEVQRVFVTNVTGPLLVAKALLGSLRAGKQKKIINISSDMGSIAHNKVRSGGGSSYAYRASKAALNMLSTCMASELGGEGFVCIALDPGWVRTDMGGEEAPLTAAESTSKMLAVIDGLGPARSGAYLNIDGKTVPW